MTSQRRSTGLRLRIRERNFRINGEVREKERGRDTRTEAVNRRRKDKSGRETRDNRTIVLAEGKDGGDERRSQLCPSIVLVCPNSFSDRAPLETRVTASPRAYAKRPYLRVCVKNIFLPRDVCARVPRQIELKDHTPLLGKEGNVFQEPPLRHPLLPDPNRAGSRSDSRNDRTESRKMLTYERDLVTLAMFFSRVVYHKYTRT